jgi:hypothetical protein
MGRPDKVIELEVSQMKTHSMHLTCRVPEQTNSVLFGMPFAFPPDLGADLELWLLPLCGTARED